MSDLMSMISNIDHDTYAILKQALELGKWANGIKLTREQKELTMMAIIAGEQKNLPEEQRSGYMGGQQCASKNKQQPVEADSSLFAPARGTIH